MTRTLEAALDFGSSSTWPFSQVNLRSGSKHLPALTRILEAALDFGSSSTWPYSQVNLRSGSEHLPALTRILEAALDFGTLVILKLIKYNAVAAVS